MKHRLTIVCIGLLLASSALTPATATPQLKPAVVPLVAMSPRVSHAPLGVPVQDRTVTFDGFRLMCGSGDMGDEDSMLDPGFVHCVVGIGVVNEGHEAIELDPFAAVIRTAGASYRPWRRGMRELFLDEQSSLFRRPIPSGGGGLAALVFLLKRPDRPVALELHETLRTAGARLVIEKCWWSGSGGSCQEHVDNGEPGNAFPHRVTPGVRYPHALELGQPTCFDRRAWWPVRGTEGLDFHGQGTIALDQSRLVAYFHDNSGATVLLRYDHENMRDEGLCG